MRLRAQWDPDNGVAETGRKQRIKHLDPYEGQDPGQRRMIGPAGPAPPVIDALSTYELKNELAQPVGRAGMLPPSEEQPTKKQAYLLTLEQAVELAQFNSRELQPARENLDLSALPVTLERLPLA